MHVFSHRTSSLPTAGTPAASGGGTEFSYPLDYMLPGTYALSVSTPSDASSTQVTVQSAPVLLQLDCPPLVQPDESFYCTAAVGGSGLAVTASFSDDSSTMTVTAPESPWDSVGHPPPHGPARAPVQLAGGEQEFTLLRPFTRRTLLMALHWHGAGAGVCELKVRSLTSRVVLDS